MKNYYSLFAAAMMLAATSCSQEEDFAQSSSTEKVTFEVNLEGAAQSRTAGDGMTATKLYYEVYQGTRKVLDNFGEGKNRDLVTLNGGKATIEMPLLRGEKYDIMFWAQADGSIYNPADLQNITVAYGDAKANNEAYDAFFYGESAFEPNNNVTKIELRRPFAQLNIGTTEADWNQAIEMIGGTSKPVTTSKVTVSGLAKAFDVLTGEASGSQDYTFETADLLKDANGVPTETFTAKNGGTYYNLAMNYLMVPGKVTAETPEVKSTTSVTATFWRDAEELFTLENIVNVPIQRNWRTNIIGNLLADNKTFEIEIIPGFENDYEKTLVSVNTPEEFAAALQQDLEHIVIDLVKVEGRAVDAKEYTLAIGAWTEKYYFGSAKTKTITINANGNTINFVHENKDWNYIRCANDDAKWIINDAHLTNSGKNDGPWNRHDIRFYNAVELNNVTSDKAIALLNDGKLNNVDITEDGDVYALWITAAGQSVEINDLDIVSVGRGIAIKDEYVDNKAKVTLNVKNAKFNTQAKAAILVTSTAGADITLENIDLSKVKADKFNAVWVDEKRAEYFDLVTVKGGSKMLEGDKSNGLTNGATIELSAGVYTLPSLANYEGITIIGQEGTVIGGENATTGFGSNFGKNTTIKNVTFSGSTNGVRYSYAKGGKSVFENCTFAGGSTYGFHIDESNDAEFIFTDCTFSGFNAFAADLTSITFNNCTFKNNGNYGHTNIWSVAYFNNCTWEDKTSVSTKDKLYFDGVEENYHHEFIGSAESLYSFAKSVNEENDAWKGQAVILVNDIDLNNQAWTPVGACNGSTYFQGTFDGNGKTISNLYVDKSTDTYGNSSAGLFGWIDQAGATIKNVIIENATVKGSHWTGVIAGYATGLIENCTVNNATVTGYNVNDDANGDKIGGIVGFMNDQSAGLIGNTVSNSSIIGNRDLGGIAGAVAASIKKMKNNSVNNVTIGYATSKDYASAGIFVCGRTGYVADASNTYSNVTINLVVNSAEGLKAALADANIKTIYLGNGNFGTIVAKSNKTIIGTANAKVDAVNLNGAKNLTLMNIKFDAATAVNACDGSGKVKCNANIVTGIKGNNPIIGAHNLVIDGCTFEGTFANDGAAIAFTDQNRKSGGSGNVTIKNCTFNTKGGTFDIYSYYTGDGRNDHGDFVIENNTFMSETYPVYLGRYASSTPVVVKGNNFATVSSLDAAVGLQAHDATYTVSIDASAGNTFAN